TRSPSRPTLTAMRRASIATAALTAAVLLAGCTTARQPVPPSPGAPATTGAQAMRPVGTPTVIASGLEAPWSILRLGDEDSTLISERDSGVIRELTPGGRLREAGTVPGVAASGEGGL